MGEDVFPHADAWWMNVNTITLFTGLSLKHGVSSIDLLSSQCLESVSQPLDGGTSIIAVPPLDIVAVQMWLAVGKCLQFEKVCKEADTCLALYICVENRGRWERHNAAENNVAEEVCLNTCHRSWQRFMISDCCKHGVNLKFVIQHQTCAFIHQAFKVLDGRHPSPLLLQILILCIKFCMAWVLPPSVLL